MGGEWMEGKAATRRSAARLGGGRSWRDLSDVVGILMLANTTTLPEPGRPGAETAGQSKPSGPSP